MAKYMKVLPILAGLLLMQGTAFATTYYVRTGGLDAHSCASATTDDDAHAKKTVPVGVGCMVGGDTLIIGDGTYVEQINGTIPSGSAGHPTVIKAANANLAILRPTAGFYVIATAINSSYVTLDGLYVDASAQTSSNDGIECTVGGNCDHFIIQNGTVTGALESGISGIWDNSQILNMTITGNGMTPGANQYHGIYLAGSNSIVDGNRISAQTGGWCIHNYHSGGVADNNIIRRNVLTGCTNGGVLLARGSALFYNNLVYSNGSHGIDVFSASAIGNGIYGNTIFSNTGYCALVDGSFGVPSGTLFKGNVCYQDSSGAINDGGTGTGCSNNLNVSSCGTTEGSTDPKFVSSGTGNFHLQAGSPAIGAGLDLSATFTTDFDGLTRTVPWDEGAYKFVASPIVPIVIDHVRRRH